MNIVWCYCHNIWFIIIPASFSQRAWQFQMSPILKCFSFKMFRDTRCKLLQFAMNRYLSLENFSIHQGTSSIAVKLRTRRLMFTEILGKLFNREHLYRSSSSCDMRFMPIGRVSRFCSFWCPKNSVHKDSEMM